MSSNSEARKAYWAGISKEERSKRASQVATEGWAGKTTEEKKAHSMKMVAAKAAKKLNND